MPKQPEYVTCEVVGAMPVRDAITGESVAEGGTVRLDPKRTIIKALVSAGAVVVIEDEKPGAKAASKGA